MVESIQTIHQKGVKLRKYAEDLIIYLKERSLIQEAYAKDLERLALKLNLEIFPEFSEFFKKVTVQEAAKAEEQAQMMNSKLINGLKELICTQALQIKDTLIEGGKNEKRKFRFRQKIEDARGKYWECCEQCEQVAVALDSESNGSKKEKLVGKLLANKNNLDNYYRAYAESIEKYWKFKKTYILKTKKFTSLYFRQEQDIIDSLNSLSKSYISITNSQLTCPELCPQSEDISVLLKYPECHFEAYEGVHPLFKNIGIHSAPHLHTSILESTGVDLGTLPAVETMYRSEVVSIISKAWDGIDLSSQEYLEYNAIIKEPQGRKAWSWSMNQKRTQGIFKIDSKGFYLISELMVAVLNECERCQDIIIAKNCIILSQTFHMIKDNCKVYLQSSIINHTVWEKNEFWEKVVNSAISEEVKNQGRDDLQSEQLKSLVFCQLVSFGNIMMSFRIDEEMIVELIKNTAGKFQFTEEEVQEIMVSPI